MKTFLTVISDDVGKNKTLIMKLLVVLAASLGHDHLLYTVCGHTDPTVPDDPGDVSVLLFQTRLVAPGPARGLDAAGSLMM